MVSQILSMSKDSATSQAKMTVCEPNRLSSSSTILSCSCGCLVVVASVASSVRDLAKLAAKAVGVEAKLEPDDGHEDADAAASNGANELGT